MKCYFAFVAGVLVATPAFAAPIVSFSANTKPYVYPVGPVDMWFTTTGPGIIDGAINEFKALTPKSGAAYVSGPSGTFNFASTYLTHAMGTLSLAPFQIVAGTYHVHYDNYGYDGYDGSLNFTATPEPSSWALMILGVGAVGFAMRRRGRQLVEVIYS